MTSVTCKRCGVAFDAHASEVRRRGALFCSRQCWKDQKRADEHDPIVVAQRFQRFIDLNGPTPTHRQQLGNCHVFTGNARVGAGYGAFRAFGSSQLAHRVAFYLAEGRYPEPQALHHCDNPLCVRRSHLFEGTQADNLADMAAKGRGRKPLTYGAST
jgi:hypothetical protein